MQDAFVLLQQLVQAIHPLSAEDLQRFSAIWKPAAAERKAVLTKAGEREKYLYMVADGVQRIYSFDDQGREATILFTYAPSFGGVLDSLLLQQPSRFFYETITPSKFLKAPFESLDQLMAERPQVAFMIRKGITLAMSGLLDRLVELQTLSSEEKFRKLLQRSPHILGLVPQKYIANYLGIDPTNFSKLVNRVRI
jgi:CRP-like cAMP-binding protein